MSGQRIVGSILDVAVLVGAVRVHERDVGHERAARDERLAAERVLEERRGSR